MTAPAPTLAALESVCAAFANENEARMPSSSWGDICDAHEQHLTGELIAALDAAGSDPAAVLAAWEGWRAALVAGDAKVAA